MKKIVWIFIFAIFLQFSIASISLAGEKLEIRYGLSVEDFTDNQAIVSIELNNIREKELTFVGEESNIFDYISNIIIKNGRGASLDYELNNNHLLIDTSNYDKLHIKYIIKRFDEKAYIGTSFKYEKGFLFGSGRNFFIIPEDVPIDRNVKLVINGPDGSDIIVPFASDDGSYYPNSNLGSKKIPSYFSIPELYTLIQSGISIGNYDLYSQKIGNTDVSVAVPSEIDRVKQERFKDDIFLMVKYYTDLFRGSVGDSYQIVLSPRPDNKIIINGFESSLNSGVNLQFQRGNYVYNYLSLAHYMFHRWNGWLWGWNQQHIEIGRLLDEGNNVYYETKSFLTLIDKLEFRNYIDNMDMEAYQRLKGIYDGYKRLYDDNRMIKYVNAVDGKDQWVIYNYGALLWLALDMKIIEDSHGKVSVDDIMGAIHERFSHYRREIGTTELLNIIKEISGRDYSDFFESYVFGTEFLDLDYYFQDDDNDGIFNYYEIMFGDKNNRISFQQTQYYESEFEIENSTVIAFNVPEDDFFRGSFSRIVGEGEFYRYRDSSDYDKYKERARLIVFSANIPYSTLPDEIQEMVKVSEYNGIDDKIIEFTLDSGLMIKVFK